MHTRIAIAFAVPALLMGTLAQSSTAVAAPRPTCTGLAATIVSDGGVVHGTRADDVIVLASASIVFAGGGNDVICGSSGKDKIYGGAGADVILARGGADVISGNSGNDTLFGELGADVMSGNSGDDQLYGGPQIDVLNEGSGRNTSVQDGVGIFIRMSDSDVRDLRQVNRSLALAATNPSTPGLDVLAVNLNSPMTTNVIVMEGSYGAHLEADRHSSLYPNTLLRQTSSIPAPAAGLYPVTQNAEGTVAFGASVPTSEGVSFRNDVADYVTVGLTEQTHVNGVSRVNPLTAVALKPGASVTTPAPSSAILWIADNGRVGAIVEHSQIASAGVTLPLTAGNTLSVILSGGTFRVE